jgi:hypothetical protein
VTRAFVTSQLGYSPQALSGVAVGPGPGKAGPRSDSDSDESESDSVSATVLLPVVPVPRCCIVMYCYELPLRCVTVADMMSLTYCIADATHLQLEYLSDIEL